MRDAAGRHVDDLAGKLAPVGQHVAAEQIDFDSLMAPAFLGQGQHSRLWQRPCHGALGLFGEPFPQFMTL